MSTLIVSRGERGPIPSNNSGVMYAEGEEGNKNTRDKKVEENLKGKEYIKGEMRGRNEINSEMRGN